MIPSVLVNVIEESLIVVLIVPAPEQKTSDPVFIPIPQKRSMQTCFSRREKGKIGQPPSARVDQFHVAYATWNWSTRKTMVRRHAVGSRIFWCFVSCVSFVSCGARDAAAIGRGWA